MIYSRFYNTWSTNQKSTKNKNSFSCKCALLIHSNRWTACMRSKWKVKNHREQVIMKPLLCTLLVYIKVSKLTAIQNYHQRFELTCYSNQMFCFTQYKFRLIIPLTLLLLFRVVVNMLLINCMVPCSNIFPKEMLSSVSESDEYLVWRWRPIIWWANYSSCFIFIIRRWLLIQRGIYKCVHLRTHIVELFKTILSSKFKS